MGKRERYRYVSLVCLYLDFLAACLASGRTCFIILFCQSGCRFAANGCQTLEGLPLTIPSFRPTYLCLFSATASGRGRDENQSNMELSIAWGEGGKKGTSAQRRKTRGTDQKNLVLPLPWEIFEIIWPEKGRGKGRDWGPLLVGTLLFFFRGEFSVTPETSKYSRFNGSSLSLGRCWDSGTRLGSRGSGLLQIRRPSFLLETRHLGFFYGL